MIINAQITDTTISRGAISLDFGFEYEGQNGRAYLPLPLSIEMIKALLDLTGVKCWEVLKGQYVRIEVEDGVEEPRMIRVGNILRDQWIDLRKEETTPEE